MVLIVPFHDVFFFLSIKAVAGRISYRILYVLWETKVISNV